MLNPLKVRRKFYILKDQIFKLLFSPVTSKFQSELINIIFKLDSITPRFSYLLILRKQNNFTFEGIIYPMYKIYLTFSFLLFSIFAYSQGFTVSGFIKDAESGEALIGANIYVSGTSIGTSTNTYGFYSITLPADSVHLTYSYIGFSSRIEKLFLDRNIALDIELSASITLDEVVISAEESVRIEQETQMSTIDIPIKQIKLVPALMGETDVMKVLQLLPGVQSGGEGQSGLYVRGGSPDQNLILLDGVPVYNASHLFGFFSVFNTDAIKDVQLIKGGFPARYGGRLSSVIDITMKEGNSKKFAGVASIGLVASRLTLEGPLFSEKTSFIVSARRTYIDVLAGPLIRQSFREGGGEGNTGYYFYDLNAKINHRFSSKDRLFFSIYGGRDRFFLEQREAEFDGGRDYTETGLGWGNLTAALRWNRQWTPKLFSNTTATYSQYNLNTAAEFGTQFNNSSRQNLISLGYLAGIQDVGLKIDFDYLPDPAHHIRFGANVTHHRFNPGVFDLKEVDTENDYNFAASIGQEIVNGQEMSLYIEDDYTITDKLKINAGLHLSSFLVKGKLYPSLQPRISARYLLPGNSSLKASFATMQQFIHLLAFEGIGLPTDLWVPSTDRVAPQRSWQTAIGYAKTLRDNTYELSFEAYYKDMSNVISYQDGAGIFDISDWQDRVIQGRGYSYGFEAFLQRKKGRLTGWIGYTLSWTVRQFDELNFGRPFPFRYDRRHDISVVLNYEITPRINISGTWVFGTGNAVTLPSAIYQGAVTSNGFAEWLEYYGNRNDFRMAPYHRLDIGVNFKKQKKYWLRTWSFGAYNTYNNNNPFFIYQGLETEFNPQTGQYEQKAVFRQASLFPIIPYFSYTAEF